MSLRRWASVGIGILGLVGLFQNCSQPTMPTNGMSNAASQAVCTFNGQSYSDGQSLTAYLSSTSTTATCTSETRTCRNGAFSGSYQYASCTPGGTAACLFNGQTVSSGSSITAYLTSTPAGGVCTAQARTCTNGVLSGTYQYASCAPAASCLFNGQTIADGQSVVAFQNSTGTCTQETRTCSNGNLSGSFQYASCSANASCLFAGQTVPNGTAIIAYISNMYDCRAEYRVCNNGVLGGSYQHATCDTGYVPGGGGDGGDGGN